jgi:hypothetical protein
VLLAQDDSAFEKQSALFALAVSDIVMINLWFFFLFHLSHLYRYAVLVATGGRRI